MQNKRIAKDSRNISDGVKSIILSSWRDGTKEQYESYLKQWFEFCKTRSLNPVNSSLSAGLDFLHALYLRGLGYSAINTARSALSTFMSLGSNNVDFGSHRLVSRFMKGIFNAKPSLPRYSNIYDPSIVLQYLSRFRLKRSISLKILTLKTVTLLALLTVQRLQTLHLLTVNSFSFTPEFVQIIVSDKLKTSRPNYHVQPIILRKYENRRLCVYRHIQAYLDRTRDVRGVEEQFFVSYLKPHAKVTRQTLSRWIRTILSRSGVDITQFCSHSTRASSASKAKKFVPIKKVLMAGGWSGESSFQRHYNLPSMSSSVQDAVLCEDDKNTA